MNSWQDYFHSDKVLLGALIIFILGLWVWTREAKLFDLASTILGALLAVITGQFAKALSSNGKPPTAGEVDARPKP